MTCVSRAALAEVDERVAGDLGGEARAAAALDAAFAIEEHEIADRDRLGEVALLLDEPRLARTERKGLVLQRALAAAVAYRAVERVVDQQELEHAVLGGLHVLGLRVDDHAVGDRCGARDLHAAHALDLDQAHAAHPHRLHPLVPAEARDVGAVLLRDLDEELPARRLHLLAVDGEGHEVGPRRDGDDVALLRRPLAHRDGVGAHTAASTTALTAGSVPARTGISPRASASRVMRSLISSYQ